MCDTIYLPDGKELCSITGNGDCLCCSTDEEIQQFITKTVPVEIGEVLIIHRDAFGWHVSIQSTDTLEQTTKLDDIGTAFKLLNNIGHLCTSIDDNQDFECLRQLLIKMEVREILKTG